MSTQNDVPTTPNTEYTREEAVRTIPEEITQAKVSIDKKDSDANCVLLPSGSINSRALIAAVLRDVTLVNHTPAEESRNNTEEWFYKLEFQFDHRPESRYTAYLSSDKYAGSNEEIKQLAEQDHVIKSVVVHGKLNPLDSNGSSLDDIRGSLRVEQLNEVPIAEMRRTQLECAEATHERLTSTDDTQMKLKELADSKYAADDNYDQEQLTEIAEQAIEAIADEARSRASA